MGHGENNSSYPNDMRSPWRVLTRGLTHSGGPVENRLQGSRAEAGSHAGSLVP